METAMPHNRRRFSRIQFQTEARLYLPNGEYDIEVADLSLKGALVRPKADFFATMGSNGVLKVRLDDLETVIRMEVTLVHREGRHIGLYFREIDLDSITHLRRLVELNSGDEAVLQRDLTALSHQEN